MSVIQSKEMTLKEPNIFWLNDWLARTHSVCHEILSSKLAYSVA
jgi:hypothetical protein